MIISWYSRPRTSKTLSRIRGRQFFRLAAGQLTVYAEETCLSYLTIWLIEGQKLLSKKVSALS
jgi:hypothetical protein